MRRNRILFDVINEPGLVFLELEVVVLFDEFDHVAIDGVEFSIWQTIFLGEESFLAGGIKAFVFRLIEMAGSVELRKNRLNDRFVALLGSADEIVVGKLEACGEAFPIARQVVAVLLRIFAFRLGSLLDLLAVFIEASEEERLATESGFDAGDDIRNDLFVGMPEVGLAVDVIDGGRDVEPFGHPGVTVKQGRSKCNLLR